MTLQDAENQKMSEKLDVQIKEGSRREIRRKINIRIKIESVPLVLMLVACLQVMARGYQLFVASYHMEPAQRQQPNKSVVPATGKQSVRKGKHKSDRDSIHTSQHPYNRITEQHLKETSLETRNKERKDLEVKYGKISSFSSESPNVETDILLENQSWDKDNEPCEYEQSTNSVL